MPSINHKRKTSKKSKSSKRSKNANRNKKTRSNMRKMRGGAKVYILLDKNIYDANPNQEAAFNDMDSGRQIGRRITSDLSGYGITPTSSTPIYDYQFNNGKIRFQLQQIGDMRNGVYIYYSNKYEKKGIITAGKYILYDLEKKGLNLNNMSDKEIIALLGEVGI